MLCPAYSYEKDNSGVGRVKAAAADGEFRVYVMEASAVRDFILIEFGLGTLFYKVWLILMHNAFLAGTGSWLTTEMVKRVYKRLI